MRLKGKVVSHAHDHRIRSMPEGARIEDVLKIGLDEDAIDELQSVIRFENGFVAGMDRGVVD